MQAMRRLTRFDIQRAAYEGCVVFIALAIVCVFCLSPLMELIGQDRPAVAADTVVSAICISILTALIAFLSGLATRAFKMGYRVEGNSLAAVSSYQPALWVAVKTASKMQDRGIENVRIFDPAGAEVPKSEWKVGWFT